jgi:hypothetical protein
MRNAGTQGKRDPTLHPVGGSLLKIKAYAACADKFFDASAL